ncbi:HotDog domain-containing protein [Pterulicium gracile]|uniref:HotDog domain-containing protein n=1 Tax=Pterulicium gracile TaxID=1884261 RepID=A0A5C3QN19_9AGAR|nr:HotDog domain-containing protein [Pterula gracilis]
MPPPPALPRLVRPPSPTSLARIVQEKYTTIPDEPIAHIHGDAPEHVKAVMSKPLWFYEFAGPPENRFGYSIGSRFITREVSFMPVQNQTRPPEGPRRNVRIVWELDVKEDMLNYMGTVHGGCISYLMDGCTSLVLVAHAMMTGGKPIARVSQQMSVTLHAPVPQDTMLRLVAYTTSVGKTTAFAVCEVWNARTDTLAATGSQIMVRASEPSPKTKL